jgi:hypothetical protein
MEHRLVAFCLLAHLSAPRCSLPPSAAGFQGKDKDALRAQVRQQIAETMSKQNPGQPLKPIEDSMVDMILQMSAVDCVPLMNNKFTTGFIGLMMYVDDQGKARKLPLNKRATQVTFECGNPTQVLGDTLIARNFDDETNFRRIDFTLKEFTTNETGWKEAARKANQEKGQNDTAAKAKQLQELLSKTQQLQQAAAAPLEKVCSYAGCENPGTLRCSRCKRSWYCSPACQKKDWKFHKANVCVAAPPTEEQKQGDAAAAAENTAAVEKAAAQ